MENMHIGQYVKLEGKDKEKDSVFTVKHLKGEELGTLEVKEIGDEGSELIFDVTAEKSDKYGEYYVEAIELAEAHAFKHTDAHSLVYKGNDEDVKKYAKEAGFNEENGKLVIHSHDYSDVRN